MKQLTDRKGDFGRAELIRRHLIEQRLKGVIVVLVDERDRAGASRRCWTPPDAAKSGSQDYNMRLIGHGCSPSLRRTSYKPGLLCMMPPSAKIVVAVR